MGENDMFSNCVIYIIPKYIGPKRYQLFKNQIVKNGGTFCVEKQESSLTHIIYDEGLPPNDPEITHFALLGKSMKIVGTKWLSECIKCKMSVPIDNFQLNPPNCDSELKEENSSASKEVCKNKNFSSLSNEVSPPKRNKIHEEIPDNNHVPLNQNAFNSDLVVELNKLAKLYQSLGEVYRSRNYFSAIAIIQKYPKRIDSYDEALTISGITPRMASKIGEILETGSLKKTNEITVNERMKVIELFNQIWGVGPATADQWFRQGHRTLDDVRSKCHLNKMQKVGMKYFDVFQKPIPRNEVEEIYSIVSKTAQSIEPTVKSEICGSYRRGKSECGDVDILILEHSEDHSQLMQKLLKSLTSIGFLSDEFMSLEASKHSKFLGMCKLPGPDKLIRRLDIFIAPFKEYAPAMIHYTGPAHFNISLRQYAGKKGMHLSENGLFDKFVKHGSSVVTGNPLPTPTEESVFLLLGITYRKPEDRITLITSEIDSPDRIEGQV